jgi:hypothetical protein
LLIYLFLLGVLWLLPGGRYGTTSVLIVACGGLVGGGASVEHGVRLRKADFVPVRGEMGAGGFIGVGGMLMSLGVALLVLQFA